MHAGPGIPDLCSPLDGNLVISIKIQLGKGDTQVGILVLINAPLCTRTCAHAHTHFFKSGVDTPQTLGGGGGGLVTKSAKSCLTLVMPWTVARQAPLSMEFSRQEYWSGLPFPSPGNLLYPGIKPGSPALQADSLLTELQGSPNSSSVLKTQVKHPGPSLHHHPCPSYRRRSASSLLLPDWKHSLLLPLQIH